MLKYFGETTNSTKSDTEFWAAIAGFVEKFGQAQKALVAVSAVAIVRGGKARASVFSHGHVVLTSFGGVPGPMLHAPECCAGVIVNMGIAEGTAWMDGGPCHARRFTQAHTDHALNMRTY